MTLSVGILGAGRIVERAHLPVLAEVPWAGPVVLHDPDEDRARDLVGRFPWLLASPDPEDLLGRGLDLVLVACPNHLHAPLTIAALEAGSHVLCEKPVATSAEDARRMLRAAHDAGRELAVAHAFRFRPEVVALRRAVQAGELGSIRGVRAGWLRRRGVPGAGSWFTRRGLAGGGALLDLGSHLLDLVLGLVRPGPLREAVCGLRFTPAAPEASWYDPLIESPATHACDVETAATAFALFEDGPSLFLDVAWSSQQLRDRTYLEVEGTRGGARLETLFGFSPDGERPDRPLSLWTGEPPTERRVAGIEDLLQPYRALWEAVAGALREGRSLAPLRDPAVRAAEILDALYDAAIPDGRDLACIPHQPPTGDADLAALADARLGAR